MSGGVVRGWCPSAWRPMAAADGLLVRVRPRLGRIDAASLLMLCDAARTYGNGLIDLTNRAALQIRGVTEAGWTPLVERLVAAGLVDPDPEREARATLMVAPNWTAGDDTHRIATDLLARLADLPTLPGKIGFAIDAGPAPVLTQDPADFRIERSADGALMLRADGRMAGVVLMPGEEATMLIALARWFADSGGVAAGRMARHTARAPVWAVGQARPASAAAALLAGSHPLGAAYALPFGRITVDHLGEFALRDGLAALRVTPWRMIVAEGMTPQSVDGLILDSASPLRHVHACVGAPECPQATVETRALARRLAPHVPGRLHVSGCAKGCACAEPVGVVLTGRDGRYDIAFAAQANDAPAVTGLDADQLLARFGAS